MPSISISSYHQLLTTAITTLGPSIPYAFVFEKLAAGEHLRYNLWAVGPAQGILQQCAKHGEGIIAPLLQECTPSEKFCKDVSQQIALSLDREITYLINKGTPEDITNFGGNQHPLPTYVDLQWLS